VKVSPVAVEFQMIDLELARQFEMRTHAVEHGFAFGRPLRGRPRLARVAVLRAGGRKQRGARGEQK
jgi:hypothetical protein